ncbi:hypothetical protein O5D80_002217 [Batrachochytrium dendrobatidis]|nr:hypothetical protein O5D80_002217 [Batrachochytrium dendrobatidis]
MLVIDSVLHCSLRPAETCITGTVKVSFDLAGCSPPTVTLSCLLSLESKSSSWSRLLHTDQCVATLQDNGFAFSLGLPAALPPTICTVLKDSKLSVSYTLVATTTLTSQSSQNPHQNESIEHTSSSVPLQVPSVTFEQTPFSSEETLPLGTAGIITVGFNAPHSVLSPNDALCLSLCVRNESSIDIQRCSLQVSALVRIDTDVGNTLDITSDHPMHDVLFQDTVMVQLVTFGRFAAGETAMKRLAVYFMDQILPSVSIPGFDIEYSVTFSAVTATGKICQATSNALQIIQTTSHPDNLSTTGVSFDEASIDSYISGLSLSNSRATTEIVRSNMSVIQPGALPRAPSVSTSVVSSKNAHYTVEGSVYSGDWQQLEIGSYINKCVAFQSTAYFYFDYDADLTMVNLDDSDSNASDHDGVGEGSLEGQLASHRVNKHGIPGIIIVSDKAVGLHISKAPNKPNWLFYERAEESRCLLMDGSEEQISRFIDGPGRYYIAVYGKSIGATPVQFELSVRLIQGLKNITPFHFLSFWIPYHPHATLPIPPPSESSTSRVLTVSNSTAVKTVIPPGAWQTGTDVNGEPLYTVRVYYKGGLHIGKIGHHTKGALIPWGGKEIQIDDDMEILSQIPGSRWVKVLSGAGVPPDAIPGGYEADGQHLYISRAVVKESLLGTVAGSGGWMPNVLINAFEGRTSLCPGKAGSHMYGCNVSFGNSEVSSVTPFEVLVYDEPPSFDS